MTVEVHGINLSPPCRAVYMTLEKLKVPYERVRVHPLEGDHRKPEFLELNPQHTVPVYREGDLVLNESRAILAYLATVHGDDHLYPRGDARLRAVVDCRLYFDMGLFSKLLNIIGPLFFDKVIPTESQLDAIKESLGWLNDFVKPTGFVAGTSEVTIADITLAATCTTFQVTGLIPMSPYAELPAWLDRVRAAVPNYEEANAKGVAAFGETFKKKLEEAKAN